MMVKYWEAFEVEIKHDEQDQGYPIDEEPGPTGNAYKKIALDSSEAIQPASLSLIRSPIGKPPNFAEQHSPVRTKTEHAPDSRTLITKKSSIYSRHPATPATGDATNFTALLVRHKVLPKMANKHWFCLLLNILWISNDKILMYSILIRRYEIQKKEHEREQEKLREQIKEEFDLITKRNLQIHNRKVIEIHQNQQKI